MYYIFFILIFFFNIPLLGMGKASFPVAAAAAGGGAGVQVAPKHFDAKAQCEQTFNDLELLATFNAIRDIHRLTVGVPQEKMNMARLDVDQKLDAFPFEFKTKKGLILSFFCDSLTNDSLFIHTPWGGVKISGNIVKIFETYKRHMKLSFIESESEYFMKQNKSGFYCGDYTGKLKNHTELDQYRGTDTLIVINGCTRKSFYKILSVNGKHLPDPVRDREWNATRKQPSLEKANALYDQWLKMKVPLLSVASLPLPEVQQFFGFSSIPNFAQAWEKCETNADKIAVFEAALQALSRESAKDVAKKQAECLKDLLEKQESFMRYIKSDLLKRLDGIIGA